MLTTVRDSVDVVTQHSIVPSSSKGPITTRIQKICDGRECGWNDTYSTAIFNGCGAPPSPSAYAQYKNAMTGLCMSTTGAGTAAGTVIDAYTCVAKPNEYFGFSSSTGQLVDSNSGKCVSNDGCHSSLQLCLQPCSKTPQWTVSKTDGTIRSASKPGICLQAQSTHGNQFTLGSMVSVGPCASPATKYQQWRAIAVPTPTPPASSCAHQAQDADSCFAAAKGLAGLQNTTTFSTKIVDDATIPAWCTVSISSDGGATVRFNTKSDSKACCKNANGLVGTAQSLVKLQLAVPPASPSSNVTITMSGPANVWFGVGFGATLMDAQPYAIIVEGGGKVSERQLAKESPGTELKPTLFVVSSTVVAGVRTVVLTRRAHVGAAPYFSFDSETLSIDFINAIGSSPTLSYHKSKTVSSISLFPADEAPACICKYPAAEFGALAGQIKYLPTGETVGFAAGRCAPQPREDLLAMKNPTCDIRAYQGGLLTCHHKWVLLDAEQEQPWTDQPLVYYKKFRIYYQEYDATKHANLFRSDWGIAADGDHAEYVTLITPPLRASFFSSFFFG